MKRVIVCLALMTMVAMPAMAGPPTLQVTLGIRETGSTAAIGADGGSSGGIEWVSLDARTLTLDGTWQTFAFDLDAEPLTAFAGATADGILTGASGTIEHIRFKSTGFDGPMTLWIDEVIDNVDPVGPPPPGDVLITSFEGFLDAQEVMFQEPTFSGSTSAHIVPGATAGVDNSVGFVGDASYKVDWQFVDGDVSRWVRLTTFSTGQPFRNPTIRFDQDSIVKFSIMGVPEPSTLVLTSLTGLMLLRRRR